MSAQTAPQALTRWYTPGRRLQKMIGSPPGGGRYPGGPYTVTQFVGAASFLTVGILTQALWGQWSWLINNGLLVGATLVVLFALRFVKPDGRNPLLVMSATSAALRQPKYGTYRGRPVKIPAVQHARHCRINVLLPTEIADPANDATTPEEETTP